MLFNMINKIISFLKDTTNICIFTIKYLLKWLVVNQ
jgi:hypothetical protein